jgi:hypothetical protein
LRALAPASGPLTRDLAAFWLTETEWMMKG